MGADGRFTEAKNKLHLVPIFYSESSENVLRLVAFEFLAKQNHKLGVLGEKLFVSVRRQFRNRRAPVQANKPFQIRLIHGNFGNESFFPIIEIAIDYQTKRRNRANGLGLGHWRLKGVFTGVGLVFGRFLNEHLRIAHPHERNTEIQIAQVGDFEKLVSEVGTGQIGNHVQNSQMRLSEHSQFLRQLDLHFLDFEDFAQPVQ